jgi:hypothetical protein
MRENNNLEYHVKTIYTTNLDQYETSNSLKKTEEKTRLQDKAPFFFLQILSSPHTHLSSHPTTPKPFKSEPRINSVGRRKKPGRV